MKKKVLLVDDEPLICKGYKQNLERLADFEVRAVTSPLEAKAAAIEFLPDIIILDYIMPELSGSDLADQLKSDEQTKNIPIMYLTASGNTQDQSIQQDLSGYVVVPKPIAAEDLVKSIQIMIGQK